MRMRVTLVAGMATLLLAALAPAAIASPGNDAFASATLIAGSPFTESGSNADATLEEDEPQPSCAPTGATIWYQVVLTSRHEISLSTFGSKFDTVLALYSRPELASLQELACSDDVVELGSLQSRFTVKVDPGSYFVQLGGYAGAAGRFTLNYSSIEFKTGDSFDDPIVIGTVPFSHSFDSSTATLEPVEEDWWYCAIYDSTYWYEFTATAGGALVMDTEGSAVATAITVFTGSSLQELDFVDCDDDGGPNWTSRLGIPVTAGVTYRIQVGSSDYDFGLIDFHADIVPPPANDDLANAAVMGGVGYEDAVQTAGAGTESDEPLDECGPMRGTVWYQYTPAEDETLIVSSDGSDFDTVIAVYTSTSPGYLQTVACNNQTSLSDQSFTGFYATAGTTYYVQAGGWYGDTGNLEIRLLRGASVEGGPGDAFVRAGAGTDGDRVEADGMVIVLFDDFVGAGAEVSHEDGEGGLASVCAIVLDIGGCLIDDPLP